MAESKGSTANVILWFRTLTLPMIKERCQDNNVWHQCPDGYASRLYEQKLLYPLPTFMPCMISIGSYITMTLHHFLWHCPRAGAPSSSVDQLTGSEGSSVDTNYTSSGPHSHSSIDSSYLSQPGDGGSITITGVDDDLGLGDDYGEFHGMSGKLEGSGGGGGGGGTSRATMVRKMVKVGLVMLFNCLVKCINDTR